MSIILCCVFISVSSPSCSNAVTAIDSSSANCWRSCGFMTRLPVFSSVIIFCDTRCALPYRLCRMSRARLYPDSPPINAQFRMAALAEPQVYCNNRVSLICSSITELPTTSSNTAMNVRYSNGLPSNLSSSTFGKCRRFNKSSLVATGGFVMSGKSTHGTWRS